jgi:hypothetical protein
LFQYFVHFGFAFKRNSILAVRGRAGLNDARARWIAFCQFFLLGFVLPSDFVHFVAHAISSLFSICFLCVVFAVNCYSNPCLIRAAILFESFNWHSQNRSTVRLSFPNSHINFKSHARMRSIFNRQLCFGEANQANFKTWLAEAVSYSLPGINQEQSHRPRKIDS